MSDTLPHPRNPGHTAECVLCDDPATADREQTRRDAEALVRELQAVANGFPTTLNAAEAERFAGVTRILIGHSAELEQAEKDWQRWERRAFVAERRAEQAERERDEARQLAQVNAEGFDEHETRADELEARLAKVPALVEALKAADPVLDELIAWIDTNVSGCVEVEQRATPVWHQVKAALTVWEQE